MLIETLPWLRYPMNIIHILQSWRNWAVKLLDWTAVLRSTIEIPIRVLINGLSSFSTYHPNIICNSRRQIDIKLIFCSLSKMYNILLSFQTLNAIVSIFGQIFVNQYKYEASYCQQLSICCIGMWWPITRMITLANCFIHYISVLNFYEICTAW